MRKAQSSTTALGMVAIRAQESKKPGGERMCDDPYARQFVSTGYYCTGINQNRPVADIYSIVHATVP